MAGSASSPGVDRGGGVELTATDPISVESSGREFEPRALLRRGLPALIAIAVLCLVVLLAPGLGEVRALLEGAAPGWIALAVAFEALSFGSYIVMFSPIFCHGLSWNRSWQIGGSELAMGSLVPASGAGGLAFGAWVLHGGGMDGDRIARRSVAFFLIKSSVNFIAVAVIGLVMFFGLFGVDQPASLTLLPALMAIAAIALVLVIPRFGPGEDAVLWATFHAFGFTPAISIVLMGYLIGQLGGPAADSRWDRRHRRRPDRDSDRLRHSGRRDGGGRPRLPDHPVLDAAGRRRHRDPAPAARHAEGQRAGGVRGGGGLRRAAHADRDPPPPAALTRGACHARRPAARWQECSDCPNISTIRLTIGL